MSTRFSQLFDYNQWAWNHVLTACAKLEPAAYQEARSFFWGSIHGLVVHGMNAEYIWHARLNGVSPSAMFNPDDYPDLAAVRARWQEIDAALRSYVAGLTAADLERVIAYRTTYGDEYQLPIEVILQHVINHATEHRSQVTPTLYNLGAATPPLDYVRFVLTLPR